MTWYDWIITLVPLAFVMGLGFYARKFLVGVSDFLVGGRVGRRYVLTTASMANCLGLISLVGYIEKCYKAGFAVEFWQVSVMLVILMQGLTGYCFYRYRETRAMSVGQYIEMRYSRRLRFFSCLLRSIAEMVANMIMPAVAARFFIAYLDLPRKLYLFGIQIDTFMLIIVVTLALAITLICTAGEISIMLTDTLQGLIFFPVVIIFTIFILTKFSWGREIAPTLMDRAAGESFVNSFDIKDIPIFNLTMVVCSIFGAMLTPLAGATGTQNAAINAHEAKMGNILATWRGTFTAVFFTVLTLGIITFMHHRDFAPQAREVRLDISRNIAAEIIAEPSERAQFMAELGELPVEDHRIGVDEPYSDKRGVDDPFFNRAQAHFGMDGQGSYKTQQYRTLFRQMLLPVTMRHLLPPGLVGLFCMMILLFILSTDDSRIYSASATLVQDCIVPFYKSGTLPPEKHILFIRLVSIGVGVFFAIGSCFTAQLDFIVLFVNITYGMWMAGCGPMLVFGLYSRFGTTAGAWASLLSGMFLNLFGLIVSRIWAPVVYPWLERHGLVEGTGRVLAALSRPLPGVDWEMNRLSCPINAWQFYYMATILSFIVYIIVSWLTCKEPYNLERLLHRGKYDTEGKANLESRWTWRSVWGKLIGIDPEYTRGDKIIAWTVFLYSFVFTFVLAFVGVLVWNVFQPWPTEWWSHFFLVRFLLLPGAAAAVTSVWFTIGGIRDSIQMFKDLKGRVGNPLDNGMVEGEVALDEKQHFDELDKK